MIFTSRGPTVWRLASLTPRCERRLWSCSAQLSGLWPPAWDPESRCNCASTSEQIERVGVKFSVGKELRVLEKAEFTTCIHSVCFVIVWLWLLAAASYPPVIGVLPAAVDGVRTTLFLCQHPLFVHVGSSYKLDSQTETLVPWQPQSL